MKNFQKKTSEQVAVQESEERMLSNKKLLEFKPAISFKSKKESGLTENSCSNIDYPSKSVQKTPVKPRPLSIDNFEMIEKIGKGAYGDVFLAQDKATRFLCVIKALSKKRIKDLNL